MESGEGNVDFWNFDRVIVLGYEKSKEDVELLELGRRLWNGKVKGLEEYFFWFLEISRMMMVVGGVGML